MSELRERIDQLELRGIDALPAPGRIPLLAEAEASDHRAAEFINLMREYDITAIEFSQTPQEGNRRHIFPVGMLSQTQSQNVKGWPILVAPSIRWALLESGHTYRLPLVPSDASSALAVSPVLSRNTVVRPYAHPDVRRFPGAEEWQHIAPRIHGLDILARAAIHLLKDHNTATIVA